MHLSDWAAHPQANIQLVAYELQDAGSVGPTAFFRRNTRDEFGNSNAALSQQQDLWLYPAHPALHVP